MLAEQDFTMQDTTYVILKIVLLEIFWHVALIFHFLKPVVANLLNSCTFQMTVL